MCQMDATYFFFCEDVCIIDFLKLGKSQLSSIVSLETHDVWEWHHLRTLQIESGSGDSLVVKTAWQ